MSRQQAYVEELRRFQHDRLVAEIRLRQKNLVFPDTVRNGGVFYRNLASEGIHAYASHRIFAACLGFYLLTTALSPPAAFRLEWQSMLGSLLVSSPLIAVGLKITVNAFIREGRPRLPLSKTYPHVKI